MTVPSLREPRSEVSLRHLAAIAFPMIVSQGSETIMLFFNRYFVSFLGSDHIPASMSGGLSQYVFTAFFTGIVGYVNALAAQYHGAGKDERCVQSVSQGLWLSLAFTPMLLALIPLVHRGFAWAGHTDAQVALEFAYFRVLMFGSLLYLFQAVLTGFFVGIGRTRVVMIANVIGIFVNVPLNWALVLGRLGIPSLGIEGAAIGTLAGTLCIVSILFAAYLRSPEWRAHGGPGAWRFRRDLAGRLLRFGTPAGAELLVNVFAFNVFVQLMHGYGPAVASAVTITFNYDLVAFIPMLGIGSAVTALVGQRIGAGDLRGCPPDRVPRAARGLELRGRHDDRVRRGCPGARAGLRPRVHRRRRGHPPPGRNAPAPGRRLHARRRHAGGLLRSAARRRGHHLGHDHLGHPALAAGRRRFRPHPGRRSVPGRRVAGLHRLRRVARRIDVAAPPLRGLGAHQAGGGFAGAVP